MKGLVQWVSRSSSKISLRLALIAPFVVLILLTAVSIVILSYRSGRRAVDDLAFQLQNEITAHIKADLDSYLAVPHQINRINADVLRSGLLDVDETALLENRFWYQVQQFENIGLISIGTEKGEYVEAQRLGTGDLRIAIAGQENGGALEIWESDEQGGRTELVSSRPDYDPRQRPWYKTAVAQGRPTWSSVYTLFSNQQLTISANEPLYDKEGALTAVVSVNIALSQISQFFSEFESEHEGEIYIIDREGLLIAASTEQSLVRMADDGTVIRLAAIDSPDVSMRNVARYLEQSGHLSELETSYQAVATINGERHFVQAVPYQDEYGLDWIIIIVVPATEFMDQIHADMRTTPLLIFLALFGAIAFGIFAAGQIATPVERLSRAAQELSYAVSLENKTEHRLVYQEWKEEETDTRVRELQQLERSFNVMACQIHTSFHALEDQNGELLRLDKLKDYFLANTSHELRTPLNGIIGIASSLIDGAAGPITSEQSHNLRMVVSSGRRLANLVNDILDLSQMEHGTFDLELRTVDVSALIDMILILSISTIGDKELTVENRFSPDLPYALADGDRVQQVLHNLVGNAIKFTGVGSVTVSGKLADASGEWLEIIVSDTGIGIPDDKLTAVFESFEQVDASITRAYGGTGLGLSVVRELVELHGGRIWVESTLGEGSHFHFTLPVSKQRAADYANDETTGISTLHDMDDVFILDDTDTPSKARVKGEYTILVVDDEPVNVQVLSNYLMMHNYHILTAADGVEALELLKETAVDLILLDIMMPNLSGYETCQRIRQQYTVTELPIIMLTAKNQVADLVKGFAVGANDYLTKPFAKDEMLSRVNTHLQLSKISAAYGRFVPRNFLQYLNKQTILDVCLGDQVQQIMTVMFADVLGFTTISEQMTPKENFDFINALLGRIGPIIRENDGFVDKYIGDAIMALFADSADKAVKASLAILTRLHRYNEDRMVDGRNHIRLGIGLHTGSLMLGTIGEAERMDTTVISDAVNLAARIEKLTRLYDANLLISEQTLLGLSDPSDYLIRFIDEVVVKGKSACVRVYELFGADETAVRDSKAATLEQFEKGVHLLYDDIDLPAAAAQFRQVLQQNEDDQAAKLHLQRIEKRLEVIDN